MKFLTFFAAFWLAVLLLFSCKPSQKVSAKDIEAHLYRKWSVHSIQTGEQIVSGKDMGDPKYEFTRTGERIKSYEVPPHSESVKFVLKADSVAYPDNPKLPASRIAKISADSLILVNDKAVWRLFMAK